MAKRINKKVFFVLLFMLILVSFITVVVIMKSTKDAKGYLSDAEISLSNKNYPEAKKNYLEAYKKTDSLERKNSILFQLADLYLISDPGDIQTGRAAKEPTWHEALQCWNNISTSNPQDIESRLELFNYYKILAKTSTQIWPEIKKSTQELLDIYEKKEIEPEYEIILNRIRSSIALAEAGLVTDREQEISDAILLSNQAIEKFPHESELYFLLANSEKILGTILKNQNIVNAEKVAIDKGNTILKNAIEVNPNDPMAYLNHIRFKLTNEDSNEETRALYNKEYESLINQFPESHEVLASAASFFSKGYDINDKAIDSIIKAIELDSENVDYYKFAVQQYNRISKLNNDKHALELAIELANKALTLPDCKDVSGPYQTYNTGNRYFFHFTLTGSYFEMLKYEPENKMAILEETNKHIHEISQIIKVEDNPNLLMLQGMHEYYKSQSKESIAKMYSAYNKFETEKIYEADLSYLLAKIAREKNMVGAEILFLQNALQGKIVQQGNKDAVLEYCNALYKLKSPRTILSTCEQISSIFEPTEDITEIQVLALVMLGQLDEAGQMIKDWPYSSEIKDYLNYEVAYSLFRINRNLLTNSEDKEKYKDAYYESRDNLIALTQKIIEQTPNKIKSGNLILFCNTLVSDEMLEPARKLINDFIKTKKSNLDVLMFAKTIQEPDPNKLTIDRIQKLKIEAINELSNSTERALALYNHYASDNQTELANTTIIEAFENNPKQTEIIKAYFESSLALNDFKASEMLVSIAEQYDSDGYNGLYFKAQISLAQSEFNQALTRINNCIEINPLNSKLYVTRSRIYAKLNNTNQALKDASTANQWNPLDSDVCKQYTLTVYEKYTQEGPSATNELKVQTANALNNAMSIISGDTQIQNIYANFITDEDPSRALAIKNNIFRSKPTSTNAIQVGDLAIKIASESTDTDRRNTMGSIAYDAYKKAYELSPESRVAIEKYVSILRVAGKNEEAEKIASTQKDVQWQLYLQTNRIEEAREILTALHTENPNDTKTLEGFIQLAKKTNNSEDLIKYTEELILIDASENNYITQIQGLIEMGLNDEAERRLETFKSKYPEHYSVSFFNASLLAAKGNFDEAIIAIDKSIESESNHPQIWRLKGRINRTKGNFYQAIRDYQKSLSLFDNPLVRIELANAYTRTNQLELAVSEMNKAYKNPTSPIRTVYLLENMYIKLNKPEKLQEFYTNVISDDPKNPYWLNQLANLEFNRNNLDSAEKLYSDSLKVKASKEGLKGYLKVLRLQDKTESFLATTDSYIDSPLSYIAYTEMAGYKVNNGNNTEAKQLYINALEKASVNEAEITDIIKEAKKDLGENFVKDWYTQKLIVNPDDLKLNFIAYVDSIDSEVFNKSIDYINKCIEIAPNENTKNLLTQFKANTLLLVYRRYPDPKYTREAISVYEDILKRMPGNIIIMNNIASLCASLDIEIEKAYAYAQEAHYKDPVNPTILDTYAFVLLRKGQSDKAVELLQQAIQQYENSQSIIDSEVYEHLGMANENLGNIETAIEAYKTSIILANEQENKNVLDRAKKAVDRLSK